MNHTFIPLYSELYPTHPSKKKKKPTCAFHKQIVLSEYQKSVFTTMPFRAVMSNMVCDSVKLVQAAFIKWLVVINSLHVKSHFFK